MATELSKEVIAEEIKKKTGIDFMKYHKPELVENLEQGTGVLSMIPLLIRGTLIAVPIWWLFGISVFGGQTSTGIFVILFIYITMAAWFTGTLLGALLIFHRFFKNLSGITDIILGIIRDAISDAADLAGNESSLPSFSDLIRGAVYIIVLPTIEEIFAAKLRFRILSVPANLITRRTMDTIVATATKLVSKELSEEVTEEHTEQPIDEEEISEGKLRQLATKASEKMRQLLEVIEKVKESISKVNRVIEKTVLTPVVILFSILAFLTVIPVLIAMWLL